MTQLPCAATHIDRHLEERKMYNEFMRVCPQWPIPQSYFLG